MSDFNDEVNRMHEKCVWIVYDGNTSSYEEFLVIDRYVSGHYRNMQILATEL